MSEVVKVLLQRIESTNEGTFGRLTFHNYMCFTGELPWRGNQSNISCIPFGVYLCDWTYSPKLKRKAFLINDHTRLGIRIHSANLMGDDTLGWKRQLNGCIALGQKLGKIDGQKALLLSKPAIREFEVLMNGQSFQLEVR